MKILNSYMRSAYLIFTGCNHETIGFAQLSENTRLIILLDKLLGARIVHARLIVFQYGTVSLSGVVHFIPKKSIYEQLLSKFLKKHTTCLSEHTSVRPYIISLPLKISNHIAFVFNFHPPLWISSTQKNINS